MLVLPVRVIRPALFVLALLLAPACDDSGSGGATATFDAGLPDTAPDVTSESVDSAKSSPPDGSSEAVPYSFVILPDTQFYARFYAQIFDDQTRWIAENKAALNIKFVLHEGDIVESNRIVSDWMVASMAFGRLDGVVPYVLAVGNHDVEVLPGNTLTRQGMINAFFPQSRLSRLPGFSGSFEPGDMHNTYFIFDTGDRKWLVLSLEFGPRDRVLAWADGILKAHPTHTGILLTHAYQWLDGGRYDIKRTSTPPQNWSPKGYAYQVPSEGVADGEDMWKKLVEPNSNTAFVFSGHVAHFPFDKPLPSVARATSQRSDGTKVHEILANYQEYLVCCWSDPVLNEQHSGGAGFLRIVTVTPGSRTISVKTYSPFRKAYKTDPANDFTVDMAGIKGF